MKSWHNHSKRIPRRPSADEESGNHGHQRNNIQFNQLSPKGTVRLSNIDYLQSTPLMCHPGKLFHAQCFVANISERKTREDAGERAGSKGKILCHTCYWAEAGSQYDLGVLQKW